MDATKYANNPTKTDAIFNITRANEYCNPQYSIHVLDRAEATKTGHLEVLRLTPVSSGGLPTFSARWDDNKQVIDVDLIGPRWQAFRFKVGWLGYHGHHPEKVSPSPRVFHIDIRIPGLNVYEADFTCNINISAKLPEDVGPSFSDSAEVSPK